MSTAFDDYLKAVGIHRQHTVCNEPHQNGVAEHANRTIGEGVTAILKESRLPPSFWGYALNAFVYAHVRSPTAAILTKQTPAELWHSEKPDLSEWAMALPGSVQILFLMYNIHCYMLQAFNTYSTHIKICS